MPRPDKKVKFQTGKTTGEKVTVPCIRCAGGTNHVVMQDFRVHGTDDDHGFDYEWIHEYQIVQCQGCDEITFRRERSNSDDTTDEGDTLYMVDLFPSRINNWQILKDSHLLPSTLNQIYQETVAALNGSQPILSGIGIRAILETVTNEEKASGANLARKIDDLVVKGKLTKDGADILHKIRTLGNQAAHAVAVHGPDELTLAMGVVEHLLESVYIFPKHAKATFK